MRLVVVAAVAAAVGVGGGWLLFNALDEDKASEPAATAPWSTCTNSIQGFSIDYPAAWYTDHPAPELACRFFDPRTFEVPGNSDFTGTALEVRLGGTFDEVVADLTDSQFWDTRTWESEAAGRRAVRIEGQSSGKLFERGVVTYGYVIDRDGDAFWVVTSSTVGIDYTPWKQIVDKAVRSVRFRQRAKSAVEGSSVPPPQAGLPDLVARKRAQIWTAAKGGDYVEVARLAAPDGFEYTFGGAVPGGPGAYWRQVDQTTDARPLLTLAAILELPYVHQARFKLYVWPYAFTRKASTLSPQEKTRLAEALGEETVKLYEQLGTYLGYRAAIDEHGAWVFYVAGD